MRFLLFAVAAMLSFSAPAAELTFNFNDTPPGQAPAHFYSTVAGQGKPGEWKIIMDSVPPLLAPLTSQAPVNSRRAVLAQTAREPVESHYPMLIYQDATFGDFTLSTRFKLAGGALEEMAGIVFRFQNESNFYVIRASGLGNNFRCYKVVDGALNPPLGPTMDISKNVWHTLKLQCEGNRIVGSLDGQELIRLVDNSSANRPGKIGFWTMADSISYFADTRITYRPSQILAQTLVDRELRRYPRLRELEIFARRSPASPLKTVASRLPQNLGRPGSPVELDVLSHGTTYFGRNKAKKTVTVTAPLRDRNGDPIAAVRVVMTAYPGETQDASLVRARPVIKDMEADALSLDDLLQ